MRRGSRLGCLVLAFATTVASIASAQPPPRPGASASRPRPKRVRDGLTGEALAAFDRATNLFADGNFAAARVEFDRAHDLSGDPRVLYNVAVCDKALKRYARAVDRLKQSLAEGRGTLPFDYVDKTNETIATLTPYVTKLDVKCDQDGASVIIDDDVVGTTPLADAVAVDVGEHVVVLKKSSFADFSARVTASSGSTASVTAALDPLVKRGTLAVAVTGAPAGTHVVIAIDGTDVGEAPWVGELDAGRHNVVARADDFGAPPRAVEVVSRQRVDVAIVLGPVRAFGRLRVATDDARDDITLDGRSVGRGRFEGVVEAGTHALRIARSGAEPYSGDVVVRRDETRSLSIQLKPTSEVPTWVWVSGGIALAGAATVAIVFLTATKKYEGSSAGTLTPPKVVPAGIGFGGHFR